LVSILSIPDQYQYSIDTGIDASGIFAEPDLNKAYLPPSEQDCCAVQRRVKVNPLVKAIERGEHIFVRAMLKNQAGMSISSRFLESALRLARKGKHEEVANILAGHIEALASQRE
jgi:hypothetical protein